MKIPVSQLPDNDMQKAPAAMARAAERAKEIARQTGTALIIIRDGKILREFPKPEIRKTIDKQI